MREIKFRQRNKNNGQWFYWGFINGKWVNPKQQTNYANPEDSDRFVGLPDKNGKEIYERDTVQSIRDKWTVFWREKWAGFFLQNIKDTKWLEPMIEGNIEWMEVISNELLEQARKETQ